MWHLALEKMERLPGSWESLGGSMVLWRGMRVARRGRRRNLPCLAAGDSGGKSSRDGCRDILGSISKGNPGAYHCSAVPSVVLRKPSSPANGDVVLEQQIPPQQLESTGASHLSQC